MTRTKFHIGHLTNIRWRGARVLCTPFPVIRKMKGDHKFISVIKFCWEGRSGDRIRALVQTVHGVQPATCTTGTGSLPWGLSVRGVALLTPSSAEVKVRVQLYLYSPSGPSLPVLGRALPFYHQVVSDTVIGRILRSNVVYNNNNNNNNNNNIFSCKWAAARWQWL